jgi:hypothetical protein
MRSRLAHHAMIAFCNSGAAQLARDQDTSHFVGMKCRYEEVSISLTAQSSMALADKSVQERTSCHFRAVSLVVSYVGGPSYVGPISLSLLYLSQTKQGPMKNI